MQFNLDGLLDTIWEYLELVRIYTKKSGAPPDFSDPVVLTAGRHGLNIESACKQIHRSLAEDFNYAHVWGTSTKHQPQRVGLHHVLQDEDVVQVVKKTNVQLRRGKDYNKRVQAHYDKVREKRRTGGRLKT